MKANKSKEISNQILAIVFKDVPDLDFNIRNAFIQQQQQEKRRKLEQAAKTLRKLAKFGHTNNSFEWPIEQDILAMSCDKPIKVVSYTYRMRTDNGIHTIQVTLSNGSASPLYAASKTDKLSSIQTL